MAEIISKTWFAVFNNPHLHGYVGKAEEILQKLRDEWCTTSTRTGAWAYCVLHYNGNYPVYDEDGRFVRYQKAITEEEKAKVLPDLHHVHMVLEDKKAMRFSFIKNVYAKGAHFEETKGSRQQALEYISKTGDYSEEKRRADGEPWEEIIGNVVFAGEISGRAGNRNDLLEIERMIRVEGLRPEQIYRRSIRYRRFKSEILADFFMVQNDIIPDKRPLKFIWHMGRSRSGKSFVQIEKIQELGRDNVFVLSKYDERGMYDGYEGQKVLIIDDFKGQVQYGIFLTWTEGYKRWLPARYYDRLSLWNEVHVTSVFHPADLYSKMIGKLEDPTDTLEQMLNRIDVIRYHYRTGPLGSDDPEDYGYIDFPNTATKDAILETVKARLMHEGHKAATFETLSLDDELPY